MPRKAHVHLIDEAESPFGTIRIGRDRNTGVVVYIQGDIEQSRADRHGVSLAPYIHAIYDLLRQTAAQKVLLIGCGGGTLATMLSGTGVSVTIVDVDGTSFDMAHRHFGLPHSVVCHVDDGAAFLRRSRQRYDAIVLDAYHDDRIPAHLTDDAFLGSVSSRLKASGILLVNAFVRNDRDAAARKLVAAVRAQGLHVRWLDRPGRKERNAIIAAGTVERLQLPILSLAPERKAKKIAHRLKKLSFQDEA